MFGRSRCRWLPEVSSFCVITILMTSIALGEEPRAVEITSPLPYGPAPIHYFSETEDDLIQQIQSRAERGELSFQARGPSGYLLDLLQALKIPVESQGLVFSKTSVNQALIKPSSPRAIYFNDDVTVGWVPRAAALEITLQDPVKGALFYTLPQPLEGNDNPSAGPARILFRRDGRCTACHISARTLNVPGHIVSSFLTDATGQPREGFSAINHSQRFPERWGGWYVTGNTPNLIHWGNLVGDADAREHRQNASFRGTLPELKSLVDLSSYPCQQSDIVALLVLNHQLHFYNLVNRVSFESRLNCRSDAEDQLVRYALMLDEAPLAGPVSGSNRFAELYSPPDTRDGPGSLRELDLKTRLFKHDVSPLLLSRSFQSLPNDVRNRLYRSLDAQLSMRDDASARQILKRAIAEWPP